MTEQSPPLVRPALRPVRSRIFDSAGWDDFPLRGDDIVIATYPKCGTTWTQRIVGMLVFGSADTFAVQETSPWPDFRFIPPQVTQAIAREQTHRRFLKSHLPYDALPVRAGVKFIHVARDGRDAAMSLYHHKVNYTPGAIALEREISLADPKFGDAPEPVTPDPAQHFHDWVAGPQDAMGDDGASFFHVETSFWQARAEPDVLLVHYNDLKADLAGEIGRIAGFLDIPLSDGQAAHYADAAGFARMKREADVLMPAAGAIWQGGGKTFINQGTNGRWKDVVRADDLDAYADKVRASFSPALARWIEHGRTGAGDPRTAPD